MVGFIVGFIIKDSKKCGGKVPIMNKIGGAGAAAFISGLICVLLKYLIPKEGALSFINKGFNGKIGVTIIIFATNLVGSLISTLLANIPKSYCEKREGIIGLVPVIGGIASVVAKALLILTPFGKSPDEIEQEANE